MVVSDSGSQLPQGLQLFLTEHRLATFSQWPFVSDCVCTPERMAEAGFIHCPTENAPDVAQCFFCFKELEGWEPDDDPMEEHRKHSPNCVFLALQKDVSDLMLQDIMRLLKEKMKNLIKKQVDQKLTEVEKRSDNIHKAVSQLRS
ncbi:baculoviral IAP repeat-containing protein 5 [Tiliqua scincoides]|uniref:baculoviral IAP repeat-containing protein 5 n=1 Tax=Tiliqua scincoides TaxID=71010 RepID=UPI00346263CB